MPPPSVALSPPFPSKNRNLFETLSQPQLSAERQNNINHAFHSQQPQRGVQLSHRPFPQEPDSELETGKEVLLPALSKATKTRMAYEANVRELKKPGTLSVSQTALLEMESQRQKYEPTNTDLKNAIHDGIKKHDAAGRDRSQK